MNKGLLLTPNHPVAVHNSEVDKAGRLKNPEISIFVPAEELKRNDQLVKIICIPMGKAWNKGLTKETDARIAQGSEKDSINLKEKYEAGKLIIWNKGLTKETDERVAQNTEKSTKTLREKYDSGDLISWNKGLTKEIDERVRKNSDKLKGISRGKGKAKSYSATLIHYQKILEAGIILEKEGYRFIPLQRIVPDGIAIKEGKISAVEVESNQNGIDRKKDKYDKPNVINLFDNVIWLVAKGGKNGN